MKIYAATPRHYALGTLVCVAFCSLIEQLLDLLFHSGWAYAVAAVLLPVLIVRMVIASRRRWVYVGAQGVAWRTPRRVGFDATPTGSVALDQVIDYRTTPQAIGSRPGQIVTLTLAGGNVVRLPLWQPSGQPLRPMQQLLQALRAIVKPTAA